MKNWFDANPEIQAIRVAVSDLNGQARGKRLPAAQAEKFETDGSRCPLSALNVDIWGEDVEDSPLLFETGDADGVLMPTGRGPVPMPWLDTPTALCPTWMYTDAGIPFAGDPRQALASVVGQFAALGLTPVVATELEFYLVDDNDKAPRPPRSPRSGKRRTGANLLSSRMLDAFDGYLTELYDACAAMDIPADTAISESGPGQFEINLLHQTDPLKAADDAWLFKQMVQGLARRQGMGASFMAKPYPDQAGNGMHIHFSLIDAEGRNVFDDGTEKGSDVLRHAVAGCLAAMSESTLIFAPHHSSYARFVSEAHAPTGIAWAYENRTAAVRIPGGPNAARRIEHRVAGGDINPYLLFATVLGAALIGIEDEMTPPPPVSGNAYEQDLPRLAPDWETAIERFETGKTIARILPSELVANMVRTKRQEAQKIAKLSPSEQMALYLDRV